MSDIRKFKQLSRGQHMVNEYQQPGIAVDPSTVVIQRCECGSELFEVAIRVGTVSAICSPNGQELIQQTPVLVCRLCGAPYKKA